MLRKILENIVKTFRLCRVTERLVEKRGKNGPATRKCGPGHLAIGDDRNLKASSFARLHRMIDHALRGGEVTAKDFTAHKAEIPEKEARVLKQNGLLREEIRHSSKQTAAGTRSRTKAREPGGGHPRLRQPLSVMAEDCAQLRRAVGT